MAYKIAGIDVHKRMLAVAVADVECDGEWVFERRRFGSNPAELRALAEWLVAHEVQEVVMESTAQYWRPVWGTLERFWCPVVARHAGPTARSARHAASVVLSSVPDPEQRLWRTLTRTKYQLTQTRVQLRNRLEALLEQAHVKLSSLVSDLLGTSARRMLHALAAGETDPDALAALADTRLRATSDRLRDAGDWGLASSLSSPPGDVLGRSRAPRIADAADRPGAGGAVAAGSGRRHPARGDPGAGR